MNLRRRACFGKLCAFCILENTAIPHGSHFFAFEMAARTCPGAAGALGRAVRACFGAANALTMATQAYPGAASALEKAAMACCRAASALKMVVLTYSGAVRMRLKSVFKPASVPPVRSKTLFEPAVRDHYRKCWSRVQFALNHCTLLCFTLCMDTHGFTLVYYILYTC